MANTDPQKIGLLRLHMAGGDPLPPSLLIYPIRVAHGYIAAALAALIGLHFVAALYHQFFSATGFFDGCGLGGGTPISRRRAGSPRAGACRDF